MKKLLVVLLALTAIGVAAFADDAPVWTWGATVETGAVVTLANTGDPQIYVWDANQPVVSRARLISGVALGNYGLKFYIGNDFGGNNAGSANAASGNLAYLSSNLVFPNFWVYASFLNNMITLNAGNPDTGFSGTVNKGWGGTVAQGFQVIVAPIDGLKVGMAVPVSVPQESTTTALGSMIGGAFYTMPNLASFAFTFAGSKGTANSGEIDFGVNVLAVPNLTAQVEGKITSFGASSGQTTELFENVAYVMGPLTPAINLDEQLNNASGWNVPIAINPNVDYAIMTGTNVGLSVTYTMNVKGGTISSLNVDPYVKFTFNSKAWAKIDANYTIGDLSNTGTWTLPINIDFVYSF